MSAVPGIEAHFRSRRGNFALDLALSLPAVGVSAIFGPSGAGKSTCLRALAGLEPEIDGRLVVGQEVWQDSARQHFLAPHRRAVGMVFQDARLFAHLSVQGNLEFGWQRIPPAERRIAFADAVRWLDLQALLGRDPASLSGGERQRVAIARALLTSPRLLLLDEPLASLDLARRREILPYLERLREVLAIPVVYVSHAPDEVGRLADHLVLIDEGRCVAAGPLMQLLPRFDLAPYFADEIGVVFDTVLLGHDHDGLSRLQWTGGELFATGMTGARVGQHLRCRVLARDVSLTLQAQEGSSILNRVPATVAALADTGTPGQCLVRLDAAGTPLLARLTRRSAHALGLLPGLAVWAQIKSVALLA